MSDDTVFRFGENGRMYVHGHPVVLVDKLLSDEAVDAAAESLEEGVGAHHARASAVEALTAALAVAL